MNYSADRLSGMLASVSHFRSIAPADLATIVASGPVRSLEPGAVIFHEGAPCAGLFVLIRGEVQLRKLGPDGREQIMSVIQPVIMFNEVPVLDGGANVATAVASQASVTWQVTREVFQELLRRFPVIGLGLLRVLARRNRFLISQYEDLSFRSVVSRVAKLLLMLSEAGRNPIDRHATPNAELAARVATVPEAFSRALRHLRESGYVDCNRSVITVQDPEALAEEAAL